MGISLFHPCTMVVNTIQYGIHYIKRLLVEAGGGNSPTPVIARFRCIVRLRSHRLVRGRDLEISFIALVWMLTNSSFCPIDFPYFLIYSALYT